MNGKSTWALSRCMHNVQRGSRKKIGFIEPSKSCMANEFFIIEMIRCLLGLFCDLCFIQWTNHFLGRQEDINWNIEIGDIFQLLRLLWGIGLCFVERLLSAKDILWWISSLYCDIKSLIAQIKVFNKWQKRQNVSWKIDKVEEDAALEDQLDPR